MTIQMKAIEQYFPVSLFNELLMVFLTLEHVNQLNSKMV